MLLETRAVGVAHTLSPVYDKTERSGLMFPHLEAFDDRLDAQGLLGVPAVARPMPRVGHCVLRP